MSSVRRALPLVLALCGCTVLTRAGEPPSDVGAGALKILQPDGTPVGGCPLRHTAVVADVAGFCARVTVRQVFQNPTDRKIEAVYVFPLPQDAAVDDMVMIVGDRRVVGQIHEREQARQIYEAARSAGHVAGLLDQERPNIFTQAVANIEPGAEVTIEISYVEILKFEAGTFEWVFPMVVGPRYIPGRPTSTIPPVAPEHAGKVSRVDPDGAAQGAAEPQGTGWAPDTDEVPDASRITPPVVKPGYRAGHDISITVNVDGGAPLAELASELHDVDITMDDAQQAVVTLKEQAELPNRDFVLRYRLAGEDIADALLLHADERGWYFTLLVQPPPRVQPARIVPRELVFVLDTSGSMTGFPIEKARQVMDRAIDGMQPRDTFNVITFSGDTRILWDAPRPATAENLAAAKAFLGAHRGSGGTEMMKAIDAALVQSAQRSGPGSAPPIRVVCFMTDGYVGNDLEIIGAVRRNAGTTRVFSFGIGNSVNRFLLEGLAQAGRGAAEFVTLEGQADEAARRFHERILAPVLTDVTIDWGGLPVFDVVPALVPDLFSETPVVVHGRLAGPAAGTIHLRGNTGNGAYELPLVVEVPASTPENPELASLWARARIADLMLADYEALQRGDFPPVLKQQIIDLGLQYRLMTQFTSFVAVEELTVTAGGEPVTIAVPVEMPDGVSYEGVFGADREGDVTFCLTARPASAGMAGGTMRMKAPSTVPAEAREQGKRVRSAEWRAGDGADDVPAPDSPDAPAADPRSKLAAYLQDLAGKVEQAGRDGSYELGKLRVVAYRVDVIVELTDTSDATRAALEELGFAVSADSKAGTLLIGSLDVRKLEDLARLPQVRGVRAVVEP